MWLRICDGESCFPVVNSTQCYGYGGLILKDYTFSVVFYYTWLKKTEYSIQNIVTASVLQNNVVLFLLVLRYFTDSAKLYSKLICKTKILPCIIAGKN